MNCARTRKRYAFKNSDEMKAATIGLLPVLPSKHVQEVGGRRDVPMLRHETRFSPCQSAGERRMREVRSDTVDLDLGLGGDFLGDEELPHIVALVSLELNDAAELLILHDVAVAAEFFLERLGELFKVEFLIQALDGS
mmetsp:Transcript_10863/g.23165  ORF Transcript_10863/g.23165 Transcript_10863/m.23165 type:complete len:138 (+) Transcript_10863:1231-1644(+)